MPIYEYHCAPCQHTFETLIRGPGDTAHCPKCGGIELLKQFSVPAAAQTGSNPRQGSLPVCETGGNFGCGQGQCATGMCSFDD
jgi:putative FmdB family regulatory protein